LPTAQQTDGLLKARSMWCGEWGKMRNKLFSILGNFAYWALIFSAIFYLWSLGVHEFSHMAVCKIIGGNPSFVQILPNPMINCSGITSDAGLLISDFQYFVFVIIPYFLALFTMLFLRFTRMVHIDLKYPFIIVLMLETVWNYFLSLTRMTDFTKLALVNTSYFMIAVMITITTLMIGISALHNNWDEIKTSFIGKSKMVAK
jgi:hypothetical protein